MAGQRDNAVVSTRGAFEFGYWGEIMSQAAVSAGLGELVIDGCVRDAVELARMGLPVFARGLCIRGTGKDLGATGGINAPIAIGDVTIKPGDAVVGDTDGVVALPAARLQEIAAAAKARKDKEGEILDRIRAGERTLDIYGWH